MSIWVALILGAVQGLTEFLPVSSSGHLTLLNKIFGIEENTLLLAVLLHLATLFAVIYVLRKEIWELIRHPFSREAVNLYIATVPTVVIVLLTKGLLEDSFTSAKLLPYCFLITAALLLVTHFVGKRNEAKQICHPKLGFRNNTQSSLIMGIAQGIAVFPGISRSGSTICAGLLVGEERGKVAKFSFLMSIPIILASMLWEIVSGDFGQIATSEMVLPIIVSFLAAFLIGILSIKLMLKVVEKAKYYWFSIYLVGIAILSFFVV